MTTNKSTFRALAMPTAVWDAADGYPAALVALLRSDEPLNRWERDALADLLAGTLHVPKRGRGRPAGRDGGGLTSMTIYGGHDVTTRLGYAGWRHDRARDFIRRKGWHKKAAGNLHRSLDWLLAKTAERYGIEEEALRNYVRRSRKMPVPSVAPDPGWRRHWLEHRERREREVAKMK